MTEPRLPALQRTEIDGVPAFWVDAGPGPSVGALVFRVGRADEPIPQGGVTHLVEHLALARLGVQPYDHNGTVDPTRTMMVASGDDADIVAFLNGVGAGLKDMPLDRIALERRILQDEADQAGSNIQGALRWYRFGTRGHGGPGVDEYGLDWLGPEPILDWARTRFIREAAAIVLSGPPPAGLTVDLPSGTLIGPPDLQPVPGLRFPAEVRWEGPGVTMTFLVPRTAAASMLSDVIQRHVRQRLRFDLGLVYDMDVDYAPLDRDFAHVTVGGDCPADRMAQVRDELLDVLDRLATDGPTPEELASDIRMMTRDHDHRDTRIAYVFAMAANHLDGFPLRSMDQVIVDRLDVKPATVADTLRESLETLLVVSGAEPRSDGRFATYPMWSSERLAGRELKPTGIHLPGRRPKERLIVGDDGLTFVGRDDAVLTVRWVDVAAVLHGTETQRLVCGADGFRVAVDAADWQDGRSVVELVDRMTPPNLVVCDEHSPGAIKALEDTQVAAG
jgi:zinc protease